MRPVKCELSRRAILGATASAGLLPFAGLLPRPAAADPRWIASEHPAFALGMSAGGLTFVAQDAAGSGSLAASTVGQAERTLDNLRLALASAGQGLDDIVFLHVLLTDYREADAVARLVQAAFRRPEQAPATCFIGVSKLDPPGRLVRMDAIATTLANRAQIVVPDLPPPLGSSVHAVRVGDLVFTGAVDAADAPLGAAEPPSAVILDRLDAVLRGAGLGIKDSFRHWSFIRNLANPEVNRAYGRGRNMRLNSVFAPAEFPANSRMGSPALGGGSHIDLTPSPPAASGNTWRACSRARCRAYLHKAYVPATGCSSPARIPLTSPTARCFPAICARRPNNACGSSNSSCRRQAALSTTSSRPRSIWCRGWTETFFLTPIPSSSAAGSRAMDARRPDHGA